MSDDWKTEFRNVWDRGVTAWKAGRRSARTMFEAKDVAFLASIGCTAQELFDFVDDALDTTTLILRPCSPSRRFGGSIS